MTGGKVKPVSHMRKRVPIDRLDIRERIKKTPLFSDIRDNEEAIDQIVDISKAMKIPMGSTIIEEGALGSDMYILHSGEVEIKKVTRAGDQYTVVRLHADRNVFFGEMALIDNDRRSASVTTTTESILLKITKQDFFDLSVRSPDIALPITKSIARTLGMRLRKTTTDMLTIFDALVQELAE